MSLAPPSAVLFDEILDFLSSTPAPEQIVAFKLPDTLQAQLDSLLDQNREGTLSAEGRDELDEFLRMDHFISRLKLRARRKLA
jgi:hypothetical protein